MEIVFWFELQRLTIVGELDGNEGKAPPSAEAQDLCGGGRFKREKETGWKWVSHPRAEHICLHDVCMSCSGKLDPRFAESQFLQIQ